MNCEIGDKGIDYCFLFNSSKRFSTMWHAVRFVVWCVLTEGPNICHGLLALVIMKKLIIESCSTLSSHSLERLSKHE